MTTIDTDENILAGLRSDDAARRHEAEHALFVQHREAVDRIMRRMLGPDMDDCVQEAFVDVFRGLRGFQGKARLSTWIYRVALRRAWKCLATRRRHEERREAGTELVERTPDKAADADAGAEAVRDELARRFTAALAQLDLDHRAVMALSALDGLGPAEIAEVLGVPVGTVHSRMSRARDRLRELLGIDEA